MEKTKSCIWPMKNYTFGTSNGHIAFGIVVLFFVVQHLGAQTVIGGITPDPSAILDVQSFSKGVLFPRVTIVERSNISAPATGLMVYNTDIDGLEINLGTPSNPSWQIIVRADGAVASINCSSFRLDGDYLKSSVAASMNSLRIPYTGGNGNTHVGQTVTSTVITGLTATLSAGSFAIGSDSLTYSLSGTPSAAGLAMFAIHIGGQSCTLKVPVDCGAYIAQDTWKVFSCYNQGSANLSADPFTPSWEINGGYWQWGRLVEGAPGPSDANTPNELPVSGWNTNPAGNNAWVDLNPMNNNPCSSGFRVPTKEQLEGLINPDLNTQTVIGTWSNGPLNYSSGVKYGNNLFLPAAGDRSGSDGELDDRGNNGLYWSSTRTSTGSLNAFYIDTKFSVVDISRRIAGRSLRCIEE